MVSDTLLIKKLPGLLGTEHKIKFLKECGAISVNIIGTTGNKHNIAFARFQSKNHAKKALFHLHQQEVLGSYLVVEYARSKQFSDLANQSIEEFKVAKLKETGTEALLKKFFDKLNCWAAGVDFRAPIPNHLNYQYPPPTSTTLKNISNQMAQSPKLYTQVLHLMNKMNLPCPIMDELPLSMRQENISKRDMYEEILSSETESEISSEEDKIRETIPVMKTKVKTAIKRPRIIKSVHLVSTKSKKQKFDDVFDDPKLLVDKKKEATSYNADSTPVIIENQGFGFIEPVHKPPETDCSIPDVRNAMEEERLEKTEIKSITLEELKSNRISEKDRSILPVFKNYAEGAPTCRLYVKNLAKPTTEEHLKFIYSRFLVETSDDSPNTFDVRLMQEGRMKGQAFVTLQTVDAATKALKETNGYILNDKPMVVQFARSAVK